MPTTKSKPQPAAHLARAENRHPVTVAFDQAMQSGTSPARWRDEMVSLVDQAAQRFAGFGTIDAMRQALDINLGLLSFGLLHRTKGEEDVAAWIKILQEHTLEDLVGETLQEIKLGIFTHPEFAFFDLGTGGNSRSVMLRIARHRSSAKHPRWEGYGLYLREKSERQGQIASDRLARFLVECILRAKVATWRDEFYDTTVQAEEVINTIILWYCTTPEGKRVPLKITLNPKQVATLRDEYEADPKAWLEVFGSRYERLLKLLSPEGRAHLTKRNWIATHVSKGPPIVSKKKWKDGDPTTLTGIFLHEVFI